MLDLQRNAGNRAIGRALRDGNPRVVAIQRKQPAGDRPGSDTVDVASDVDLESPDFWAHLMTRTMIAYSRWISDTRQAINQFVTDMGASGPTKVDWAAVMQAWLGTVGTAGDVTNALWISTKAVIDALDDEPAGLSLAEMSDKENAALQDLSNKTANVKSDLPIYKLLQGRKAAETSVNQRPPSNRSHLPARAKTAVDLNQALERLARPESLRQKMTVGWIKRGVKSYDVSNLKGSVVFFIQAWFVGKHKVHVRYIEPALTKGIGRGGSGPVDNEAGTLRALKGAYGAGMPLSKLPLNMVMDISHGERYRLLWARRGGTWAPVSGLGSERQHELVGYLREQIQSQTVGDLLPYDKAVSWH